jgi:hypothetical protein
VGVLDETFIPQSVQIARAASALVRPKFDDVNIIPSPRFANRMQRLMHIGHKVDQKLQRLNAVGRRSILIGQNFAEHFDAIDNAIVVILKSVFILRAEAIPWLVKTCGIPGNVHEVPAECLRPLPPDFVSPSRDGGKIIAANQLSNDAPGRRT